MTLVRRLARPLIAAPFISSGVTAVRRPADKVQESPSTYEFLEKRLASTPVALSAEQIARVVGIVGVSAGGLYAVGKQPRAAAAVLTCTSLLSIAARKPVWKLSGSERQQALRALLTDLGLTGAILLAAVDTDGKPSLGYRAGRTIERGKARKEAERAQKEAGAAAEEISEATDRAARKAAKKQAKQLSAEAAAAEKAFDKAAAK